MAIYRQQRHINIRTLVILAVVVIALIIVLVLVFGRSPSITADPFATTRAKILEAAQGLDILTVEYPQGSEGSELTGIHSNMQRAKAAFEVASSDLVKIDANAVAQIESNFTLLEQKISANASADEVIELADKLKTALLNLRKVIPN